MPLAWPFAARRYPSLSGCCSASDEAEGTSGPSAEPPTSRLQKVFSVKRSTLRAPTARPLRKFPLLGARAIPVEPSLSAAVTLFVSLLLMHPHSFAFTFAVGSLLSLIYYSLAAVAFVAMYGIRLFLLATATTGIRRTTTSDEGWPRRKAKEWWSDFGDGSRTACWASPDWIHIRVTRRMRLSSVSPRCLCRFKFSLPSTQGQPSLDTDLCSADRTDLRGRLT
jgi:hypothetical protein